MTAYDQAQAELRERLDAIVRTGMACDKELAMRLDAALQRIEQLELEVARLKGPQQPSLDDPKFYGKMKDYLRSRGITPISRDANGSPLPDEAVSCQQCGLLSHNGLQGSPAYETMLAAGCVLPDEGT